ncbi:PREDICTED: niban-like protein 1 [Condylura cristata]|uniref:niban-like protein 1 n=1 Tax=Condylura cristata TaxID=143302 RepID=UPI0006435F5E|nr:PREDICTED: niban-like protein 1 [Condylura cristata]
MGDVLSTHLDDARRQHIAEKTGKILTDFLRFYEDQYGVALFNSMRHEIEGLGAPQPQLLWRKVPLEERIIFSGNLFQYQEDNKKWRNRFSLVPHNYGLVLYENKVAYERQVPPRAVINTAGYKILTSVDQYLELVGNSLPGITSKSSTTPILKCPTKFPLILWHPSARHYYFCMMTEAEQDKWQAVLQDCIRHCNNGEQPWGRMGELPRFQELIFEDFARFILVENTYEEVVLQTVMKDILQAVKEAAVQRKHNLYRDSVVMHNSDPNLHLLAEGAPIDWGEEYSGSGDPGQSPGSPEAATLSEKRRRAKQVVSVVQDEEAGLPFEATEPPSPASPDSVAELRGLLARDLRAESAVHSKHRYPLPGAEGWRLPSRVVLGSEPGTARPWALFSPLPRLIGSQ